MPTQSHNLEVAVVVAPVRVDLSAGFPDVQPFCRNHPGHIVNVALDLSVDIRVRRSLGAASPAFASDLPQRLVSWTANQLGLAGKFDIRVATPGLTPGSGLGASGALSVAVAYAMLRWEDDNDPRAPEPGKIVALSVRAERAAGITGGTQDQWASAYGGWGTVSQHSDWGERVTLPVPASLAAHLMLVRPGGTRDSGAIVRRVTADTELERSGPIIEAMSLTALELEAALRLDDVVVVARLVDESRELLARLNAQIVSRRISSLLQGAPGLLGAKPCGAGGESAAWIAIVEPEAQEVFIEYVRRRGPLVTRVETSLVGVHEGDKGWN